ncbi:MAG TPA: hypothetical protein VN661_07800 [Candidatus Acidoferrales bacterium]|nr:hypothetical protein [Candidatus Acidoferrales bacterium]
MRIPPLIKQLYKICRWASLILLVFAVILVTRKSSPPGVPYDPTASARVQQKFAAAELAKSAGRTGQVELDRTELNSYLRDNLALEGQPRSAAPATAPASQSDSQPAVDAPATAEPGSAATATDPAAAVAGANPQTLEQVQSSVKDVNIDMEGDLVTAYVIFDFHGKDLSLELAGRLGTRDGYLNFEPVEGKLGSLPLPKSTLDAAVEKLMASPENREKLKLPPDIKDVEIAGGQAVITYN